MLNYWKRVSALPERSLAKKALIENANIRTNWIVTIEKLLGCFRLTHVPGKKFRDTLTLCGLKIRVVERTGDSIKSLLTKSDPFRTKTCDPTSCIVCSAFPKISCKTRDCVYKITCKGCGEFYIGETSRSIGQRYTEHCVQQRNQSSSSVFAQHFKIKHGSNQQDLELKVLKSCPGDPMLRQVTEAVHIAIEKPSLNTKQEWRRRIMSDS